VKTVEVVVEGDKFNVVALALGSCAYVLLTWWFDGSAVGGGGSPAHVAGRDAFVAV
jgi:hypothetical protein